jgi:CRP/FNR family transcriptional regulator, cyclic AMP receptor protein
VDAARLKSIPLFADLTQREREAVARLADEVEVPAGKQLATTGEFAYEFFVIKDGTAEVTKDGERIAELGPNDFFGEIGLLETERRTANVEAKTPMELIVIFGPNFRRLERELPEIAAKVRKAIRERLKRG